MRKIFHSIKRKVKLLTFSNEEKRHNLVGPGELWKMKRDFQIIFLKNSQLEPHDYLLDIGCGTLRGGLPIIDYLQEGHYFGIDSRNDVLEEGRKELTEAGLEWKNPTLISADDISNINIDRRFEFVWAFSVLIHMADDILDKTLFFVSQHLLTSGVFYANVNIGNKSDGEWQGFPVVWRPLKFYEEACLKYGLMLTDLGALGDLGHNSNSKSQDAQRMLKIQLIKNE